MVSRWKTWIREAGPSHAKGTRAAPSPRGDRRAVLGGVTVGAGIGLAGFGTDAGVSSTDDGRMFAITLGAALIATYLLRLLQRGLAALLETTGRPAVKGSSPVASH